MNLNTHLSQSIVPLLDPSHTTGQRQWTAFPQVECVVVGLILWGATDETFVRHLFSGNEGLLPGCSNIAIPGRIFEERVRTPEEILDLVKRGDLKPGDFKPVESRNSASPYNTLGVVLEGPCKAACLVVNMWRESAPPLEVKIEPAGISGFVATVNRYTLHGVERVLRAEAPTAEICAELTRASIQNARTSPYG